MNTCKDCRFWTGEEDAGAFVCQHPHLNGHVSGCAYWMSNGAYPWGSRSMIFTGPDFGCIHWTAKPPQPEAPQ